MLPRHGVTIPINTPGVVLHGNVILTPTSRMTKPLRRQRDVATNDSACDDKQSAERYAR